MYCKKCGAETQSNSVYCPKCGVKLGNDEEMPEVPYSDGPEGPGTNAPLWEPGSNKNKRSEDLQYSDETSCPWDSEFLKYSGTQGYPGDLGYQERADEEKTGKRWIKWLVGGTIGVVVVAATGILAWKILKPSEQETLEPTVKIGEAVAEIKNESSDKKTASPSEETEKYENIESKDDISVALSQESEMEDSETNVSESEGYTFEQNSASGGAFLLETAEPDLTSLREAEVITANATSVFSQSDEDHSPMLLFHKKDNTYWQEGIEGPGKGESVSFGLDDTYHIQYLGFKLGNWTDNPHYSESSKPKTVTITAGGSSGQVTFDGDKKVEWVKADSPVTADSVMLKIDDVDTGTAEDTCITEIMIYGK